MGSDPICWQMGPELPGIRSASALSSWSSGTVSWKWGLTPFHFTPDTMGTCHTA